MLDQSGGDRARVVAMTEVETPSTGGWFRPRRGFVASVRRAVSRMPLSRKFLTVIVVEIVSYSIVTFVALAQIHNVGAEIRRMAEIYIPMFAATESVRRETLAGLQKFQEIIFIGDRVVYDEAAETVFRRRQADYLRHFAQIDAQIDAAEAMLTSTRFRGATGSDFERRGRALSEQLTTIRRAALLHDSRVNVVFRHVEDGSFLMGLELVDEVEASGEALNAALDDLVTDLEALKTASVAYAQRVERHAAVFVVIASIATVCIVITFFTFVVRNSLTRPLRILTDAIDTFQPNDAESRTPLERELMRRGDELGHVGRRFARLKNHLRSQSRALRSAKEEAERANRSKSHFLAAASHDMRQPLHAMQMYLEALRHRATDSETMAIISEIEVVSQSTGALLNALLDLSQIEAGIIEPLIGVVEVDLLIRRVLRAHAPLAYKKGLSIRYVSSRANVVTDQALFERVIGNFVSNAIRYTETGRILIGCRRRGAELDVQVWDTGVGIAPEHQHAIFEEFYQVDNRERDRSKGLGLGLAIVKRLAKLLGHRVTCRSWPKSGSCFAISVLLAPAATGVLAGADHVGSGIAVRAGRRVLLLEDDQVVRRATAQLLHQWGYVVTAEPTLSQERIDADCALGDIDLIITDFRLPGEMNGVDIALAVRHMIGADVPIIVVTGEANSGMVDLRGVPNSTVAIKPLRPARLRALINSADSKGHLLPNLNSGLPLS